MELFTYDFDDPDIKPQLTLLLPYNRDNDSYLQQNFPEFKKLGLIEVKKADLALHQTITVSSKRKVARIVKAMLSNPECNSPANERVISHLTEIDEHLTRVLAEKKPAHRPPKSKNYASYIPINEKVKRDPEVPKSLHKVIKVKKESKATIDILKIMDSGGRITEIEAFNALCYRLLLNDRTPMVRSVHDDEGNRIGVLSTEIADFQSLHEYYLSQAKQTGFLKSPSQTHLIESGIGRILAAAYCEEENDLSGANIGYDALKIKAYKIDHDQATWPFTAKYLGVNPSRPQQSNGRCRGVKPIDAFPVTQRDLNEFPYLMDAKPRSFPDECDSKILDLVGIKENAEFNADVQLVFLKRILITEQIYRNIAAMTIGSPSLQQRLVAHKTQRGELLKKALLKNEKFCNFMIENPNLKEQLRYEFGQYNDDFNITSLLRINLEELSAHYESIMEKINSQSKCINEENYAKKSIKLCDCSSSFFKADLPFPAHKERESRVLHVISNIAGTNF